MRWNEWHQEKTATDSEYREAGRTARKDVPRSAHAEYSPHTGRDPLGIIEEQNVGRIQELVPLRMQRMSASAFAFYRGTAGIQAADLSSGLDTGHFVVACGDAHVNNYGIYAAPDRSMVFDMNDFDEAAPAPWEWDVKRLSTSAVLAARENGFGAEIVRQAAQEAVVAYRTGMQSLVELSPLERYYVRLEVNEARTAKGSSAKALKRTLKRAEGRTSEAVAQKLMERNDDGEWRFVENSPVLTSLGSLDLEKLLPQFQEYLKSAAPDIRLLLLQYEPLDLARRVVGVGSVGTRCYIAVLQGPHGEPLILQLKEAGRSVLVEYGRVGERLVVPEHLDVGRLSPGQRVVMCQRMLQASSDPFLGFIRSESSAYYVRQFRDRNTGIDLTRLDPLALFDYVRLCGRALARGHAQSPGASFIVEYLGKGNVFDTAVVEWSLAYAVQAENDFAEFVEAIKAGRFPSS